MRHPFSYAKAALTHHPILHKATTQQSALFSLGAVHNELDLQAVELADLDLIEFSALERSDMLDGETPFAETGSASCTHPLDDIY
jgi:hypothetical protein